MASLIILNSNTCFSQRVNQGNLLSSDDYSSQPLLAELLGEPSPAGPMELVSGPDGKARVRQALALTKGNVSRAADLLGISRVTLYKKLAIRPPHSPGTLSCRLPH
ncbi:MAG: helix-turn-helix domain-containing protein [Bacillota bacterium]